jgi:hypothetical protein
MQKAIKGCNAVDSVYNMAWHLDHVPGLGMNER